MPRNIFLTLALLLPTQMFGAHIVNAEPERVQTQISPAFEQIRIQHQRILDEMNEKDKDGKAADLTDPKMAALLKRGWNIAGMWASEFLESHPRPTQRDLDQIFAGFAPEQKEYKTQDGKFLEYRDYGLTGSAVQVGPDVYVVHASYALNLPSTGTFMIVARNQNGRFQALWNIKDLAEQHYPQGDEIGRWMHLTRRAYYNGPLDVAKIMPLPKAANGQVRFLVDAYMVADGSMGTSQLSIWKWDGNKADLLLIGLYQYALDSGGFDFDGKTLKIVTKEMVSTFYTMSPDPEPRGIWTVSIKPEGVQDLGRRFEKPELHWADELFSKIHHRENVGDLADAKVVEKLKTRMEDIQEQTRKEIPSWDPKHFSWGELVQCKILNRGRTGAFELTMMKGHVRLRYVLKNGKPYFTEVKVDGIH